jgi:hypothetical protein
MPFTWSNGCREPDRLRAGIGPLWLLLVALGASPVAGAQTRLSPADFRALDIHAVCGPTLVPGRPGVVQVVVRAARALGDIWPVPLARVELSLSGAGRPRLPLAAGRADLLGRLALSFRAPDWPAGTYRLRLRVRSAVGAGALEREVQLARRGSLQLVTDKEVYRPGATVRLRLLAAARGDRRPLTGERLLLELYGPAGRIRASRVLTTGVQGTAAAAFALDDRWPAGIWRLRASGTTGRCAPVSRRLRLLGPAAASAKPAPESQPERAAAEEVGRGGSAGSAPPGADSSGLRLRSDARLYRAGDSARLEVRTPAAAGCCFVEASIDGRSLRSLSAAPAGGVAGFELDLGPELVGPVDLCAYRIREDGRLERTERRIRVLPQRGLRLVVARDRVRYRPGQAARIRLRATDDRGRPRRATLAVAVVAAAAGGRSPLWDQLRALLGPRLAAALADAPAVDRATLLGGGPIPPAVRRLAAAPVRPAAPAACRPWSNPVAARRRLAEADRPALQRALQRYGSEYRLGERSGGGWRYPPHLIERLVKAGLLTEQQSRDPLGRPYTMATVAELWPELGADRFLAGQELRRLWRLRNALAGAVAAFESVPRPAALAERLERAYGGLVERSPELVRDQSGAGLSWQVLRRRPGFRTRDFLAKAWEERVAAVFRALARYGRESLRWYRLEARDAGGDDFRLPPDVLARLIQRGWLTAEQVRDPWGRRLRVRRRERPRRQTPFDRRLRHYAIVSSGPDGRPDTADDVVWAPWADAGLRELARWLGIDAGDALDRREGPMPSAGGAEAALDGGRNAPAEPAPPAAAAGRTLLFAPALVTDAAGWVELELQLEPGPDRWRLDVWAHTADGALGAERHFIPMAAGPRGER